MNGLHTLAIAWLLFGPTASLAEETTRTRQQADAERAAVVARLQRGHAFRSGGEQYRVLGGVRALQRVGHESEAQVLARAGAVSSDVIDRKGREYVVVRSRAAATPTVPRSGNLTAVNVRTGNLAVLSGLLAVGLRQGTDPADLARAHGLVVVSSAPRLAMTFLRVPVGGDSEVAAADLARDPGVESVEIEVIEHLARPH